MNGKDLIVYILQNNLENEPVSTNGGFLNMLSVKEAAAKFNVGEATVRIWYQLKAIDGFAIGDNIYILPSATPRIDF